LLLLMKIW